MVSKIAFQEILHSYLSEKNEEADTKLFNYICRYSKEKNCKTTRQSEIQVVNFRNTRFCLLTTLKALKEENLNEVRACLAMLKTSAPFMLKDIKKSLPSPIDFSNLQKISRAIEEIHTSRTLNLWMNKKAPHELRGEANLRIYAYASDPKSTRLDLSRFDLRILPDIFNAYLFRNLAELNLQFNDLTHLPDTFKNLRNLRVLSLSDNQFRDIPELLIDLPKLKYFHFNRNPFQRHPREDWMPALNTLIRPSLENNRDLKVLSKTATQSLHWLSSNLREPPTELPFNEQVLVAIKLFKYLSKFLGKPATASHLGRAMFFNESGYSTTEEIKLLAIKHIFAKSTRSYLIAILRVLRERNFDQIGKFIEAFEAYDPLMAEELKRIFPSSIDASNFAEVYYATDRLFVTHGLKVWTYSGTSRELRERAVLEFKDYLNHPKPTYLNLSSLYLRKLPNIFDTQGFQNLEILDLESNQLTDLPNTFSLLNKLKKLYLNHNELSYLPDSFANLEKLQKLSLTSNKFLYFPEILCYLTELKVLFFTQNQITSLTNRIGRLTNLTELRLDRNRLKHLPDTFTNLTQLKRLHLEINSFTAIPLSLVNLPKLEYFSFNYNLFILKVNPEGNWVPYLKTLTSPSVIEDIASPEIISPPVSHKKAETRCCVIS